MMKFTFLTCAHPALARRGQGLRHRRRDDQRRARAHRPGRRPISPSTPIRSGATSASPPSAAVIMLLITLAIFLPLVLAHRLAGPPPRARRPCNDRRVADAAAPASAARRALSRAAGGGSAARRSPSSSFCRCVAAFVAIPLYVVIVTSFKPIDRDHARPDLRAADARGRSSPGTRRGTRSAPGSPATASSRASSTR